MPVRVVFRPLRYPGVERDGGRADVHARQLSGSRR